MANPIPEPIIPEPTSIEVARALFYKSYIYVFRKKPISGYFGRSIQDKRLAKAEDDVAKSNKIKRNVYKVYQ